MVIYRTQGMMDVQGLYRSKFGEGSGEVNF